MCQPLTFSNFFGDRHARVEFSDNNNIAYCLDDNVGKNLESIKFIIDQKSQSFPINGLQLYLSLYLSEALNKSISFVRQIRLGHEDNSTGLYSALNGDIFGNSRSPFAMTNQVSGRLRPIASPYYHSEAVTVLSILKPVPLSVSDVLHIFDFNVYYSQLFCVLSISLFLRYCQPHRMTSSGICKRSLFRQLFEIFLLTTFEPRTYGLLKEKNLTIRLIITTAILTGFLMKKTFCSKLNALFAFQSFNYVSDLNCSLSKDTSLDTVYVVGTLGFHLIRKTNSYTLPKRLNLTHIVLLNVYEKDLVRKVIDGEAVLVGTDMDIKTVPLTFPFLPLMKTATDQQMPVYNFPISKRSRYFHEIYKR